MLIKRGKFLRISIWAVLQLSWISKTIGTWLRFSLLIFSSWARNDSGSAFQSFSTLGQTSRFDLGFSEWSSAVLSHCMDTAAPVSLRGLVSGSLCTFGVSLCFFNGVNFLLLLLPTAVLLCCWLRFVLHWASVLCAEIQNVKWSGEMTRLWQVSDLNSKAQLNSMGWGRKVFSPQTKWNYSPTFRIHVYLHSWLLNIEIHGI